MFPTLEAAGLIALGLAIWFWRDTLSAREAGIRAARAACQADGLQLLDDTVATLRLRLVRDDDGRLRWQRVYGFEYSDTGNNRRAGSVTLVADQVRMLSLPARPIPTHRLT